MKTYDDFLELLNKDVIIPVARDGSRIEANAEDNPCATCARAEYNKLCTDAQNCAALHFHTVAKMPSMVHDFFTKDEE